MPGSLSRLFGLMLFVKFDGKGLKHLVFLLRMFVLLYMIKLPERRKSDRIFLKKILALLNQVSQNTDIQHINILIFFKKNLKIL